MTVTWHIYMNNKRQSVMPLPFEFAYIEGRRLREETFEQVTLRSSRGEILVMQTESEGRKRKERFNER